MTATIARIYPKPPTPEQPAKSLICAPVLVQSSSRRRCRDCELYFTANDGIGHTCLNCYAKHWEEEDFDPWAWKDPIPTPPTALEIQLDQQLTRCQQALYFLYVALDRAKGPQLPSRGAIESALAMFKQQYPEFA